MRPTRREALAGAAVAAVAARVPAAQAAGNTTGVFTLLVAYQQEVQLAYDLALRDPPLSAQQRKTLQELRDQAALVAEALRSVVAQSGGDPVPGRSLASVKTPVPTPALREFLRNIVKTEEAVIAGYYGALQSIASAHRLRGIAAFMAQAGRRLVVVRELAGDPLLPRAFETGQA
jgi:hypothetical protein